MTNDFLFLTTDEHRNTINKYSKSAVLVCKKETVWWRDNRWKLLQHL